MENPRLDLDTAALASGDEASAGLDQKTEFARRELLSAIAMVTSGMAASVVLCGLSAPESLLATLAATAAAAGVALRSERQETGGIDFVIGRP